MTAKISAPTAVLEAALYTADLDETEAFYSGVLGLPMIGKLPGRHMFFRCGSTIILIFNSAATRVPTSNPRMPIPTHGADGPGHLCFAASLDDIDDWVDRLAAAGVPIEADFCWPGGARSIYFRDPAGNSLEFAEPRLWDLEINPVS